MLPLMQHIVRMLPVIDTKTEQYASLLHLPAGVVHEVITRLSLSDCAACMLVDKELKSAATVGLRQLTSWNSDEDHEVSHLRASRLFKFLAQHSPNLTSISCCFTADRLPGGNLAESSLGSLAAAIPRLTHLTLLNVDVTDTVLQHLARCCVQLQHLAIGKTQHHAYGNFGSDVGIAAIAAACRKLSSLCLFRCYSCGDAGLREISRQGRHLTRLILHSCHQVTAAGLTAFIESMPGLQVLDVLLPLSGPAGPAVNFHACFALAANCHKLKVLHLSEEFMSGAVLDDASLSVIARSCLQLQELELVQIEVTDGFMTTLAQHCTQLTSLRLEQTYVGDEGVTKVLNSCPGLKELRVAGCSTHSWMLPAEYMFAGLSVDCLMKLARQPLAGQPLAEQPPMVGPELTSLDLSCLTVDLPTALWPAAGSPVLAAAFEAAGADVVAAIITGASLHSAVGSSNSSSSVLQTGEASNDSEMALVNVAASSGSEPSQEDDCSSSSSSWGLGSRHTLQQSAGCHQQQQAAHIGYTAPAMDQVVPSQTLPSNIPLVIPVTWCAQLVALSLDWLKADGEVLQANLFKTLTHCSRLQQLSLVGYQGNADQLLAAAAMAGAHLTSINLQHSQVTDAGLAAAATDFPQLASLHLSYCRHAGDAGLSHVLDMQHLQELGLYSTPCVSAVAVAKLARYCRSLRRLYISHKTGFLNRTAATITTMGYISHSCNSNSRHSSSDDSSVWAAVTAAAAARKEPHLSVICHDPSSETDFERRTLQLLKAEVRTSI